ncbi:MAG: DNA endonuclease SmrA [Pseudomonadota bacterium]
MDDEFRKAMEGVQPLDRPRRKASVDSGESLSAAAAEARRAAATGAASEAAQNPLTEAEVDPVAPHAVLAWRQDGVQTGVFDRLRTGAYPVAAELDLHGRTVREARGAVFHFLRQQRALGRRVVLIAHGRGEKSPTPGRLKSFLARWLTDMPEVIAFHSAIPRQGGTGAVYALLKKVKGPEQPRDCDESDA